MIFSNSQAKPSRLVLSIKRGDLRVRIQSNGCICLLLFCVFLLNLYQPAIADDEELSEVHSEIVDEFPDVHHISDAEVEPASESVLYLDVRRADEYAVSHLEQAIRVDPGISASDFEQQFAEKIQGKKVIFYCSVGVRSSELINRLYSLLDSMEDTQAVNLEGGIFRWHNKQRPLYRQEQQTDEVHPFNWYWSRLLDRSELASYGPDERVE